jgi:hypothetical protein
MFLALWVIAWLLTYRVIGRKLDPLAAIERLQRWQDIRPLERWTIFRAYTQMRENTRDGFQEVFERLGCQAYKEFTAVEQGILLACGEDWLRREILLAFLPSPNPNMFRPWPSLYRQQHRGHYVTFVQVQAWGMRHSLLLAWIVCLLAWLFCIWV